MGEVRSFINGQVLVRFDNLHSVAIMQDALNRIEAVLKSHDYENKHEREETEV